MAGRHDFLVERDEYWRAVFRTVFPGIRMPPDNPGDPAHEVSLLELEQGGLQVSRKQGIAIMRAKLDEAYKNSRHPNPLAAAEVAPPVDPASEVPLDTPQLPWYERAEALFLQLYPHARFIYEMAGASVHRLGWYKFTSGPGGSYYEEWTRPLMREAVFNIFAQVPVHPPRPGMVPQDETHFSKLLTHLEGREEYYTRLADWDNPRFLNVANGLLDVQTRELRPASPGDLYTYCLPVQYLGKEGPYPTPCWDRIRAEYPTQLALFENMERSAIFLDHSSECLFFMVGPTGSGKGTVFQVHEAIFGTWTSHIPFKRLGDSHGKQALLGKRFVVNRDMIIAELDAETLGELKDLVTHEGRHHVNPKYLAPFEVDLNVWFLAATNQTFQLPRGADRAAWFRRVVLVEFTKQFKKDPQFKNAVLAEKDAIFTNLVNGPYTPPIPQDVDTAAYVTATGERWDYWANPVYRVLARTCVPGQDATTDVLDCDALATTVDELLKAEGIIAGLQLIKQQMTMWFTARKVRRIRGRKSSTYAPARITDPEVRARYEQVKEEQSSWGEEAGQSQPSLDWFQR